MTLSVHIVTSPAAALIHRATGAPTVQYFHAKEIGAKPRLAAFAARHARATIAVSDYTARLVAATGATPAALSLIPPGVDLPAVAEPLPEPRPTLLTIARLEDRYKGHDVIIRALPLIRAAVPDAQWVVIGDGPLRSGLERLAAAHGVADAIRFLGAVDDEERNAWLRRAHALAMPSRLPDGGFAGEGFGIVYLEAGAYGKPVLAGNVAGALDAVADGETGLLVDPADHLAVAAAATRLLRDRELAARLGAAGAARARELAWPRICRARRSGAARARGLRSVGRVRVLYVNHTAEVSGAERSLLDLIEGLPAMIEPLLATPEGRLAEEARRLGIPTTKISGTAGSLKLHPARTPRALAEIGVAAGEIRRAARRHRAVLIHANSVRAGVALGLTHSSAPPPSSTSATACRRGAPAPRRCAWSPRPRRP